MIPFISNSPFRVPYTEKQNDLMTFTQYIVYEKTEIELRVTSSSWEQFLEMVMKQMYMAYIRNVKFTSPSTWPNINFMRRSLAEIFLLDHTLCYKYAFVYIRQLTIHLRNAMVQVRTL